MKNTGILLAGIFAISSLTTLWSQQQPNNAGFENWDAVGSSNEEPTNWSGMMTGNLCGFCGLGASQRVFRDASQVHSGAYSARIQSTSYLGNIVNGAITTGQVNAPSTTPSDGYNQTVQSNGSFNHAFTSKPDSVVIWAKYNTTTNVDSARISITLHSAYDVRDPQNAASAPYVVARAVRNFQTNGTATWKRISIPFSYAYPATNVAYMLASVTSSKTAGAGSSSATLWIDDMSFIYNPPVTNFTASNVSVCAGESITFTNTTTSGTTATWLWNFGDLNTSTSQSPTHTYATPGMYTVQLTATNAGGSDVETLTVTVNAAPTVAISGPSAVCLGSSATITASGANGYVWDNGLGTAPNPSVSPTVPTTYTVTGTTAGCSSNAQITIGVDTQNSSGTSLPLSACLSNTSVDLFTGLNGEVLGGTWSDDDLTGALSGSVFNPSLVAAGNYDFTYTHAANGACPAASTTVQVAVTSSVSAGSPSGQNQVCLSDNAFDLFGTIVGYSSGGIWNDDDLTGALTGNTLDATQLAPGSYNFTYNFLPGSCGTDTETISIVVSTPPTITSSGNVSICMGESTPIGATGGVSYTWDNGLGSGANHTVAPTTTTLYTVTGTDASGCSDTDAMLVTVNQLPVVSAGMDQDVCEGSLVALYGNGAVSYGWSNGVQNGVSFIPPVGTTTYTVLGTDANGCENSDEVDVTTLTLPVVTIGNFSQSLLCTYDAPISLPSGSPANGFYSGAGVSGANFDPSLVLPATHTVSYVYTDGNGCTNFASTTIEVSLCLGIDDLGNAAFSVAPNPADEQLTIQLGELTGTIVIRDAAGREMTRLLNAQGAVVLDTRAWASGTYFALWISEDGKQQSTQKLSITH